MSLQGDLSRLGIEINTDQVRRATQDLQGFERQGRQVESTADRMARAMKSAIGMVAGAITVQQLTQALFEANAALQDFQTRYQALAGSQQAAAAEMEYVRQAAQKLALDLNTARDAYAQLLDQQQAGVITTQQARDLLEGFGRAAQMTGAGAEQVKQAMAGLSQALSSGTVSTEDFRQAVDPLPGMMRRFAEAMGGISIAELKENLEDGKINSEDFAKIMIKALQDAGKGAQDFSMNLNAVAQRIKNEWTLLLETFGATDWLSIVENSSFNDMATSMLNSLEQALKDMTALIKSGLITDAFGAQVVYLKSYWDDFKKFLIEPPDMAGFWSAFGSEANDFFARFREGFTDLPKLIVAFTVITASTIDQWGDDLSVVWTVIKASFALSWEGMKQFLVDTLNSMIVAVANAVNNMGEMLSGFLSGAAAQLRELPEFMMMGGMADAIQAGADQIKTVSAELVQSAEERRQAAIAESQTVIDGINAQVIAERQRAEISKQASQEAERQTILEHDARVQARDATVAQAQEARRASEAAQQQAKAQLNAEDQIQLAKMKSINATEKAYEASRKAAEAAIRQAELIGEAWLKSANAVDEAQAKIRAEERAKKEIVITPAGMMGNINLDALVKAVIKIESANNPSAVSGKGAIGLMQIMPPTARDLGYTPEQMRDPKLNREAGVKYLQQLLNRYAGDVISALAAYNGGMGNVDDYLNGTNRRENNPNRVITPHGVPNFDETQKYVAKVWAEYQKDAEKSAKEVNAELNQQVLYAEELQKLDKQRSADGKQMIGQAQQQTAQIQLQAQLIAKQYQDYKVNDFLTLSAQDLKSYMDLLQQKGIQEKDAAAMVTQAISGTEKLRDAEQTRAVILTNLNQAIEQHNLKLQESNAEWQRQQATEQQRQALMERQIQTIAALKDGPVALNETVAAIGVQFDGGLTHSQAAVESYFALIERVNARMREMQQQGYNPGQMQQEAANLVNDYNQKQIKSIDDLNARLIAQRQELEKNRPSWAELTGEMEANNLVKETTNQLDQINIVGINGQTEALKGQIAAKKDDTKASAEQVAALQKVVAAERQVADYYLKSLTPMERYQAELKKIDQAREALASRKDQGIISPEQLEKERRGLEQWREDAEQLRMEADPMAQAFKSAAEGIYNAWSGMWESLFTNGIKGFGDMVDQLKTMFLKMIAQMAAAALAKPILLPVVQTMGGMFGLENATMAPIVNNIFGAGTMTATGAASGGGFTNSLSSGFGLFGKGGIGSGVGGVISGIGGLLGGGAGAMTGLGGFGSGLMGGGAMMSNLGLFGGIANSFTAGLTSIASGAVSTGIGMMAAAAIPVIGAIGAIASLIGDFGPTPHPSSIFTAGGFWQSENGPEYPGKGGGVKGASGIMYGYDYGHTDPKEAEKMRDSIVELDKALTDLAPSVDLAGVKLGEFGQTAEGFIANGKYVEDMDAVIEGFVKAWVNAAAETGAVSEQVSEALSGFTGSAEDLTNAFAILQQMDAAGTLNQQLIDIVKAIEGGTGKMADTLAALSTIQGYVNFDSEALFADWETQLQNSLKTTFDRLGDASANLMNGVVDKTGKVLQDGLAQVDWTDAESIQEVGALVQARYALEIQMLQEIEAYLQGLSAKFGASIESIQLDLMDNAEKFTYFSEKAQEYNRLMTEATDPAKIAEYAELTRGAIMSAWGLMDESQKEKVGGEFITLLQNVESTAATKLQEAQKTVLKEHETTAELLRSAIEGAGAKAAEALAGAMTEGGDTISDKIKTALQTPIKVDVNVDGAIRISNDYQSQGGFAAGGFVGGTWNGQRGIAGDTVVTALTPGEAVISRDQTQKHRALIEAIMTDDVRYAAGGFIPDPGNWNPDRGGGSDVGGSTGPYDAYAGTKDLKDTADALNDFMASISDQINEIARSDADRTLERLSKTMNDNIAKAKELGASERQLAKIRILSALQVQEVFNNLLTKIQGDLFSTIDQMRLSVMTDSEKYDYYTQIAETAFESLKTATDPGEIERLAGELNEATKSAWGLLDDSQRKATLAGFEQFLVDAEDLARTRLEEAQTKALEQMGLNAQELTDQIGSILRASGDDLGAAIRTAMDDSGNAIGKAIEYALSQPIPLEVTVTVNATGAEATAEVPGMAAGGIVGGTWNGKTGIAGDTVLTALTPGEAVIPRDQTERHRPLIEAIMADQVRYAAFGDLPSPNPGAPGWGTTPGNPGGWGGAGDPSADEAANNAEQLADLIKQLGNEIRDMGLTDFARDLAQITDRLADTQAQIAELGGSAEATAKAIELATLQEAKLREEYAERLADLLQPYQDLLDNTTEFDRALRDLADQTADALEQAANLATSEEELATVRQTIQDAALLQEQQLREDYARSLSELLTPYQNVLDGTSEFQQSLRDFARQTEEAIEQARQLGASEAQLDLIRQSAAQQQQKLHQEFVRQVQDFMQPFRDLNAGTTEFEKALRDLTQQTAESLQKAKDLGLGEIYLAEIRQAAAQQEQDLRDEYARNLNELLAPYQNVIDGTSEFQQSLRDFAQKTADAVEQARQLGASEAQLEMIRQSAAQQTQKLHQEYVRQVQGFMRPFRDLNAGMTEFQKALRDLQLQTEESLRQAQELGLGEIYLAEIRQAAAQQEADLREEQARQTRETLRPYQDAISGLKGVALAYRDWQNQTEEAIRQAQKLGLTEDELAVIRAGADAQLREMAREWRKQLDGLLIPAREFSLSDFAKSLRDLNRQISSTIDQAIDLGASEAELAEIRAYGAAQAKTMADAQTKQVTDQFQAELDQVKAELDQFTQSIKAFDQALENNRVQVRRASKDWDEVAYQTQRLAELEARRATENTQEQLATLGEMQEAIMARYQAEQQALNEVVANIERLRNLAKQLRDFLDSLKLGNLTPLSPEARLNEAARQYQTTLAAAQGGDEEAIAELSGKAQAYLTEARAYYASSTQYARIFDGVVAAVEAIAGGIEAGPTVDEIIAENTGKTAQLMETTIAALDALEAASRELQAQADAEAQKRTDELTAELNAQTQAIQAELAAQRLGDANYFDLTAGEFRLLRSVLIDLSAEQLETLSSGFAGMAEATRTLQGWMETGTISSTAALDRVIEQLRTGSGANQTMIGLLQTRVNQGGADAVAAQAMLERLQIAQGAYDTINSILAGIRSNDIAFNDDTIARLREQLAILAANGQSADQNALNLIRGIHNGTGGTTGAVNDSAAANARDLIDVANRIDASIWQALNAYVGQQDGRWVTNWLKEIYLVLTQHIYQVLVNCYNVQYGIMTRQDSIINALWYIHADTDYLPQINNGIWAVYDKLNRGVDTYAGGGAMQPGLALVGEEGPELVQFTQPGYVYTAEETKQILGRGARQTTVIAATDADPDNRDVVVELKALVRVQSAANQQLIAKLDAVESRLAGIESKARLEAAA